MSVHVTTEHKTWPERTEHVADILRAPCPTASATKAVRPSTCAVGFIVRGTADGIAVLMGCRSSS